MRIGMLTSGGDCPGLNAVIRGVVRKVERVHGGTVVGFRDAWKGVLEDEWEVLDVNRCRGILPRGGTILGTSRVQPYQFPDGVEMVKAAVAQHRLDGFVVIGGDGSLGAARDLQDDGVNCIGVPKTIDNDIAATEMTFGFDTAVHICSTAIDRLHTTAEAHDRVMVVEVMGRDAGHIAVRAGLAGGATMTLIPEVPFDIGEVCDALQRRHAGMSYASIVVVAEGATPAPGTMPEPEYEVDRFGHRRLGGISQRLAEEIEGRTGIETRVTILGHVQRGGTPTAFDRVLATRYGVAAADAAADGAWGQMVALQADHIVRVPLHEATGSTKQVDLDLYDEVARPFFAS
ncbi:6-phosphofructokinase [Dermatobacter hominis]|uniref:6-phosphofructokinase n=1 Tax=Dermatobacter hominis TaxID=2884263 RepID=UPI001D105AAE|nr:ATP-dependent 6-phosphofructokinase [Dermatobacter hominis]UDY35949.1 6-phosphofructokinase [Dermatobacter hominis]